MYSHFLSVVRNLNHGFVRIFGKDVKTKSKIYSSKSEDVSLS